MKTETAAIDLEQQTRSAVGLLLQSPRAAQRPKIKQNKNKYYPHPYTPKKAFLCPPTPNPNPPMYWPVVNFSRFMGCRGRHLQPIWVCMCLREKQRECMCVLVCVRKCMCLCVCCSPLLQSRLGSPKGLSREREREIDNERWMKERRKRKRRRRDNHNS